MGAPFGNTYAKNGKGGGRPSAYEENMKARGLIDAWFDTGVDIEEAQKIINKLKKKKGKIKIFDLYKAKAVMGKNSDRIMLDQAKKIFPDKIDMKSKTENILDDKTVELLKYLKKKEKNN